MMRSDCVISFQKMGVGYERTVQAATTAKTISKLIQEESKIVIEKSKEDR